MIRLLIFLGTLTAIAFGFAWLADRPGDIVLTIGSLQIETSLAVGLGAALALFAALWLVIALLRTVWSAPGMFSAAGRRRNFDRGREAVARGMVALAAGDARGAHKASEEATRRLRDDPLALLLHAQHAQLTDNREAAGRAFRKMVDRADMRLLGLRGLHSEALRTGDAEAAHDYAKRAHAIAPLPWAARSILERLTSARDWAGALKTLDTHAFRKSMDQAAAERHRAVLSTAAALDLRERDPDEALALAREALKAAPDLTPAAVAAAQILTQRQEIRKATRLLERAWKIAPHPDLARMYLEVRHGDSASDKLSRARTLARLHRDHPESAMIVARAAIDAREFEEARRVLAPLIAAGRPTRRVCLLMADLEERERGADAGSVREWLARAARAPRDPAWVADGFVSDVWAPISPITGRLDAFVWKTPDEQLSAYEAPAPSVQPTPPPGPANAAQPRPLAAGDMNPSVGEDGSKPVTKTLGAAPIRPVFFSHPTAPDDPGAQKAEEASTPDEQ